MNTFSTRIKDALWSFKQNRKAQVILVIIILLIIALLAGAMFFKGIGNKKNENEDVSTVIPGLTNTVIPNSTGRFIDGIKSIDGEENLYPNAVMIENLVTIRPQSGLIDANVVYETLAEGGITRFMALYADRDKPIEVIGPVRSARSYFVDWAEEYKALYAHAGGSPQALTKIAGSDDIINLDQIGGQHAYFWRDKTIEAPHNLFTSSALLELAHRDKSIPEEGNYIPWKFNKEEVTLGSKGALSIDFSSFSYSVRYTYDAKSNSYLRFHGDDPHMDKTTKQQISAKNVIVQITDASLLEANTGRLDIETTGKGTAFILVGGKKIDGTWEKKEDINRTVFSDSEGNEVVLNPGKTWVEVVPTNRDVTYTE